MHELVFGGVSRFGGSILFGTVRLVEQIASLVLFETAVACSLADLPFPAFGTFLAAFVGGTRSSERWGCDGD